MCSGQVFLESIRQFVEGRPGEVGEAVFDKEDDLAVEFVTAASNLRAAAYGIPQQSHFDAKVGMLELILPTLTIAPLDVPLCGIRGEHFPCQPFVNEDCASGRVWQATSSMQLPPRMPLLAD